MSARARIGISGWTYAGWRRLFYPEGLPARHELAFAALLFDTIEINGTFYRMQRPQNFAAWRDRTPDGFRFAVKGSRFITHMKQLRDVEAPLANFFASGVLRLEEKLGPLLWQFSDRMRYDRERFDRFMSLLPHGERAASELARGHDHRVRGRASYHTESDRRILHAIEVRNASFMCDDFLDLLRGHRIALVFSDAAADWPYAEDVTSDFVYLRLHGAEQIYASGYDAASLDRWARKIRAWLRGTEPRDARRAGSRRAPRTRGRDAWVFFDNDAKVHAPFDAMELADRLNVHWRHEHAQ
ncbi:MAG TPA: DUF72 domain-containing protein [Longimicrobiales bacterium]